ncbi:DIS3-like exonuclease 2 [Anopheles albimanus]|uniref:DIS3-like exonuclease 2 n=1 Tax=Anopheles albimanus TaxID=7167 RepID=A0A182FHJ2_ANOAL|nr:DIS3-like exonuclease 2 [Anopheles albimanus]
MSDEDFFRGIRDDIVNSTAQMQEASATKGKSAPKAPKKPMQFVALDPEGGGAAVQVDQVEQQAPAPAPSGAENDHPPPAGRPDPNAPAPGPSRKIEKKQKKKEAAAAVMASREALKQKKKNKKDKTATRPGPGIHKLEHLKEMIDDIKSQIDELKHDSHKKKPPPAKARKADRSASAEGKGETKRSVQWHEMHAAGTAKSSKHVTQDLPAENGNPQVQLKDLPSDQQLLLALFTLNASQRQQLIEKIGLDYGLLMVHPQKKDKVVVTEAFRGVAESLHLAAMEFMTATGKKKRQPPKGRYQPHKAKDGPQEKVKQPERQTFEAQVSYLLNDGKTRPVKEYKPELTLGDRGSQNATDHLIAFVDRLVANRVGYLVEGPLRINPNYHYQSFVDDPRQEGNVFINSILLRQCAMEGDVVQVFVKFDESKEQPPPPAALEAEEEASLAKEGQQAAVAVDEVQPVTVVDNAAQPAARNGLGFVVRVLEKRHNRQCVGTFAPIGQGKKHYRMFMPRDKRIPAMRVLQHDLPNAFLDPMNAPKEGKEGGGGGGDGEGPAGTDLLEVIYQAQIVQWQDDVPIGTILRPIGKCGQLEVENEAILVEYNLDVTPYPETLLAALPPCPYTIPEEELAKRTDLRGECIFTIDPATARDLDDALSCKLLPDGNYEIGVHISDVTYFLREGSPLDEQVKLRATSIYMVDGVHHMLPKQLCNSCSLLPGQDKLAFSVLWKIRPEDGQIVETRFARTIINSCAQLSYEHAQLMLDNPDGPLDEDERMPVIAHGYTPNGLRDIVNRLQSIAVKLRKRRMDGGCLKINQPKLTFRLDPATGRPLAYGVYQLRASNELIEDFMLLANVSVAEAIHAAYPAISLLRSHRAPSENMMKKLVRTLAAHGYTFSYDSSKAIRESMEAIATVAEHPDAVSSVLSVLLAKPMTRALYYCSTFASSPQDFAHYALAIPLYTHFTSPIRRYADCLVHRVLAASLGIDVEPKRSPDEVQRLASICNEKKYNAKLAGDASSLLYFRHWLSTAGEQKMMGAVLGYGEHHIELVLIHTGLVVKVFEKKIAATAKLVFKAVEPTGSCLLVPKDTTIPPVKLQIFTKVRVMVKVRNGAIVVTSVLPLLATSEPTVPTVVAESNAGGAPVEEVASNPVEEICQEMASAKVY